jgi:hypothetical protein
MGTPTAATSTEVDYTKCDALPVIAEIRPLQGLIYRIEFHFGVEVGRCDHWRVSGYTDMIMGGGGGQGGRFPCAP